jgi:hypothetical protein
MKDFLAWLGVVTLLVSAFFVISAIYYGLREQIDRWKYNYRVKHRFDKPPTAKCYCVDCKLHSNESKKCYKFDGWHTADNWFCWDAEPREKED